MEFLCLATGSIFVIVDPIATISSFMIMTRHNTIPDRIRMAKIATFTTWLILTLFALAGRWIFLPLGITMPAFQIAGGFVMLLISFDMLRAQRSAFQETEEEKDAGILKEDIAVTPLAIPMLAGPGAISTVMLLAYRAESVIQKAQLYLSIIIVALLTYFIFYLVACGHIRLGPISMKIMTRLMGLFLAAVAVQFILNGWTLYTAGLQ